MSSELSFFKALDTARIWRIRELSDLRTIARIHENQGYISAVARSAIVLAYSHWEGYWADCTRAYVAYQRELGRRLVLVNKNLLVGLLGPRFNSLRDKNFSDLAKMEFVNSMFAALQEDFTNFDDAEIRPRSNLNFERVKVCAAYLRFDVSPLQKYRNTIDLEVVGWRHSIAHGENPSVPMSSIIEHLRTIDALTAITKDIFIDHVM